MISRTQRLQEAELKRLTRVKAPRRPPPDRLGPQMIEFFKHSVQKRQTKFCKIAQCWSVLVPPLLNEHCALETFHRGSLTVLVDTSSHLYELSQLLLAGHQRQLLLACQTVGLPQVTLKPGPRYYGSPTTHNPPLQPSHTFPPLPS